MRMNKLLLVLTFSVWGGTVAAQTTAPHPPATSSRANGLSPQPSASPLTTATRRSTRGSMSFHSPMPQQISFQRDRLTLAGNLYTPPNFDAQGHYNALIVQGSLSSVKEQMPALYARHFADQGFVVLTFDYSHYGQSEGEPRQVESPAEKLLDLQAAVTYLTGQPYVQAVGMVGVCTSGGNAAYLAAADQRIQALATIAGLFSEPSFMLGLLGEEKLAARRKAGAAAKRRYTDTGEQTLIPVYSETDQAAANYAPTAGAYDYYLNPERGGVPAWRNAFAVQSWNEWLGFDPISKAAAITMPTIVVHSDGCAFPDQAKKFYAQLPGEKELVWADGTHYDYYDSPAQVANAVKNVTRYFNTHLK
jgi:uncharacterized protein